jgi:hypothetical protein
MIGTPFWRRRLSPPTGTQETRRALLVGFADGA